MRSHFSLTSFIEIAPASTRCFINEIASATLSGNNNISQPASYALATTSALPYLSATAFMFNASEIINPEKCNSLRK